ncbi:MAG: hypothetical protein NZ602_01755 [Thermoguttaceae bacterium]|nr:hypothetical protein [Thermoguttaceae bacterium]MDW8036911.1 hypothetical protein [Thermoguttaceae bacterium]
MKELLCASPASGSPVISPLSAAVVLVVRSHGLHPNPLSPPYQEQHVAERSLLDCGQIR